MRGVLAVGLLGGLGALAGCGGGGPAFVAVSGRVTLNDQPVEGCSVDFQPLSQSKDAGAPGSTGKTDKNGRFVLHSQLDPSRAGAVVGKHQVRVWAPEGAQDADADNPKAKRKGPKIPGRYHVNSELTFEVPPGGTDRADFALKSP